jgi:TonB family protein
MRLNLLVWGMMAILSLNACKNSQSENPTQEGSTTQSADAAGTEANPENNPEAATSPTDTSSSATPTTIEHTDGATVPMPSGVREYNPPAGYVDNTPDPDPTELVMVDQEAVCLNLQQVLATVAYPADARAQGVSGAVYLKVLVDGRGLVKSYKVRRSPDARLTKALVEALAQLRFRPAFKGGQPVKTWEDIKYSFQ